MRSTINPPNLVIIAPDFAFVQYSLDCWVTGAPIATDPADPNSTPPLTNRIVMKDLASSRGQVVPNSLASVRAMAIGGTSIVVQPWFYEDVLARWVKFGATSTITLATTNQASPGGPVSAGAKIYLQVTSNNGVTALGYAIV